MLPINANRVTPPRTSADSTSDAQPSPDVENAPADHTSADDALVDDVTMDSRAPSPAPTGECDEAMRADAQTSRNVALSRIVPIASVDTMPHARVADLASLPDAVLDATLQASPHDPDSLQFQALRESLKHAPLADAQRLFGRLAGRLAASPLSLTHWGTAFEQLASLRPVLCDRLSDAILALLPNREDDRHGHAFCLATESVEAVLDAAFLRRAHAMESSAALPIPPRLWDSTLASLRCTDNYCEPWRLTRLARAIPSLPEAHRTAAVLSTLKAAQEYEGNDGASGWGDLTRVLIDVTPARDRLSVARDLLACAAASNPSETMDVFNAVASAIARFPEDHAGPMLASLANFATMRFEYGQLDIFTNEQSLDALKTLQNATALDPIRRYPRPDFDALLGDTLEALAERVYTQ
ncbi:hypothetical protein ACPWR0_22855 [Pandoraea pneumonica]|uniref:hypothetical protein n=1 Tax=Pandoraea pneumonica TaxID=2508299 RepID=UPI003CF116EC